MFRIIYIVLFIFSVSLQGFSQSKAYTIRGELMGARSGTKVFLLKQNTDNIDSTLVHDRKFIFRGTISEPIEAIIIVGTIKNLGSIHQKKIFWLEHGTIDFTGSISKIDSAIVRGSRSDIAYKNYVKFMADKGKGSENDFYDTTSVKITEEYIISHPNSYKSAMELYAYRGVIGLEKIKKLYRIFPTKIKASSNGRLLKRYIKEYKQLKINDQIPDFGIKTISGKAMRLTDLRGKYVLIDFWSSWCGPCRNENKGLVKLYAQYKEKGFEILGIGLDKKEDLKKAIKNDEIVWLNTVDDAGFKSKLAYMFGVWFLPQNFLVDPNGKIIGKDFRNHSNNSLSSKLDEIFKTK